MNWSGDFKGQMMIGSGIMMYSIQNSHENSAKLSATSEPLVTAVNAVLM